MEFAHDLDFYRDRARGLAAEFVDAVEQAVAFIRSHPSRAKGTPALAGAALPYSVIYREEVERIYVLALAHSRRRAEYWHDRL